MSKLLALALTFALSSLTAASVSAQDDEVAPAHEPPQRPGDESRGMRLRFGFDLAPTVGTTGYIFGLTGTGRARVGLQLNDDFAVFYQGAGIVGGGVKIGLFGSGDSSALFLHTSSAVVEATVADLLQVSVGPSFAAGVQGVPGQGEITVVGGGFTGRVAVTFGGRGEGDRQGFSLGAQVDVAFLSPAETVVMAGISLGWETF